MGFSNSLFLVTNFWIPAHEKSQLAFENLGIPPSLHFDGIPECSSPNEHFEIPLYLKFRNSWNSNKKTYLTLSLLDSDRQIAENQRKQIYRFIDRHSNFRCFVWKLGFPFQIFVKVIDRERERERWAVEWIWGIHAWRCTMHQPWASLLVYGIKRIEGRSWPAPLRGTKP